VTLPTEVQEGIARGVAAYVRGTESAELPGPLRRFKGFTDRGVKSQAGALVSALTDDGLRARIIEWLDDKPKRIPPRDEQMLRIACERAEGWQDRLGAMNTRAENKTIRSDKSSANVELEREREKVRKARQEARAAREAGAAKLESERARADQLAAELSTARSRAAALESELTAATKRAETAEARLDREVRKARRDADKAIADRDAYKEKERTARKELAAAQRDLQRAAAKPPVKRAQQPQAKPPARRKRLPAPLGRLADDPETLAEWLDTDAVRLVIDGYNVTKAEGGFGDLSLEVQRERLIDSVGQVVRGRKVTEAVIVFDGSDAPVVASRRSRGKVRIEYSAPDVIADDHIVALVKSLPTYPVVVVTNDRELQNRVARLAATVARSDQLIALFR
jgi:predicted RNA-binding protein with PIN domain